jgi:hypothetical protein
MPSRKNRNARCPGVSNISNAYSPPLFPEFDSPGQALPIIELPPFDIDQPRSDPEPEIERAVEEDHMVSPAEFVAIAIHQVPLYPHLLVLSHLMFHRNPHGQVLETIRLTRVIFDHLSWLGGLNCSFYCYSMNGTLFLLI